MVYMGQIIICNLEQGLLAWSPGVLKEPLKLNVMFDTYVLL